MGRVEQSAVSPTASEPGDKRPSVRAQVRGRDFCVEAQRPSRSRERSIDRSITQPINQSIYYSIDMPLFLYIYVYMFVCVVFCSLYIYIYIYYFTSGFLSAWESVRVYVLALVDSIIYSSGNHSPTIS